IALSALVHYMSVFFLTILFFFNTTTTTQIYTLSLHDALPISNIFVLNPLAFPSYGNRSILKVNQSFLARQVKKAMRKLGFKNARSEEHTSELQSRGHLVCRLLLEKKKKKKRNKIKI